MAAVDSAGQPPSTGRTRNPVPLGYWHTPAVRADMVLRYVQRQQSMRRIAADLGCGYGTVNAALTAEGVQKRGRGGSISARRAAAAAPGTAHAHRARPGTDTVTRSTADSRGTRPADGGARAVS